MGVETPKDASQGSPLVFRREVIRFPCIQNPTTENS